MRQGGHLRRPGGQLAPTPGVWHSPRVPVRAVLFDADGVIQFPASNFEACLQAALGHSQRTVEAFVRDASAAELTTLTGERDFVEVLTPLLEGLGAAGSAQEVAACWCEIEADEAILQMIRRLRRTGWFCAIATNQHRERGSHMARVLGYDALFERSFYSYELGHKKPDAEFFRAILRRVSFLPEEILFIDDHEANVEAAAVCGFTVAHFVHDRTPAAVLELAELLQRFSVPASP